VSTAGFALSLREGSQRQRVTQSMLAPTRVGRNRSAMEGDKDATEEMLRIAMGALRKAVMKVLAIANKCGRILPWPLAVAVVSLLAVICLRAPAGAEADVFQKAVNYVFTGEVDPTDGPEIIDRKSCVVVMRDPKFNRYIRYYMSRFKMDVALFDKKYSGSRVFYTLSVKGDDVVIEYLKPDKKTVTEGYRSAQISLPGDIDQTRRALRIIFTDHCKPEKPKTLF
jgi:hypothetical protein